MYKDELITKADLEQLKTEIKDIIISLIDDAFSKNKWLKSNDIQKMLGVSSGTLKNLRLNGPIKNKVRILPVYNSTQSIMII